MRSPDAVGQSADQRSLSLGPHMMHFVLSHGVKYVGNDPPQPFRSAEMALVNEGGNSVW